MPEIIARDVWLRYGAVDVLKGASFSVDRGKIVALLGPSGSGKTSLLRAIAGLEKPNRGHIGVSNRTVFDHEKSIDLPAEKRGLGFVFQSYALWPHRTVFDNVAYGLRVRGVSGAEKKDRVYRTLEALGLATLAQRFPHQLSGGQQQRVAIARSLVYEPDVILLDEPLSNLDAKLRDEARAFLKELIAREKRTAVIVTHDQLEALAIADSIVLLNAGAVEQQGSPAELYNDPESMFAAEFIGSNVLLTGPLTAIDAQFATIAIGATEISGLNKTGGRKQLGERASLVMRMERAHLAGESGPNRLPMTRTASMFLGDRWEHVYRADDAAIRLHTASPLSETQSFIEIPANAAWIF